jgi:hypothetical protein
MRPRLGVRVRARRDEKEEYVHVHVRGSPELQELQEQRSEK